MDIPRLSITPTADIEIPQSWQDLPLDSLTGTVVVIGETDSGKSTFVRWLITRLLRQNRRTAWLDADVGQSSLGLPATINLTLASEPDEKLPKPRACFFVGATSPRGHMLPMLAGSRLLQELAYTLQADTVVVDTTGLVSKDVGGGALKEWKIILLRASTVIAIQHQHELEHILAPLRQESNIKLHQLQVAKAVCPKSREERRKRRGTLFQQYFSGAAVRDIDTLTLPVYGRELIAPSRLMAFQDKDGFVLELGVVGGSGRNHLSVITPLPDLTSVHSIRIGQLRIDPRTGQELD